jgi:hypothetical protein
MAEAKGAHHGVDYIELAVTDMSQAKAFYEAAFGWKTTDYGPDYVGFADGARGEREAGGFRLANEVTPGGPLIILYSENLEASAAAVRAAGGTITKEIFEFPGGRRFEFDDPCGNRLGVWGAPSSSS